MPLFSHRKAGTEPSGSLDGLQHHLAVLIGSHFIKGDGVFVEYEYDKTEVERYFFAQSGGERDKNPYTINELDIYNVFDVLELSIQFLLAQERARPHSYIRYELDSLVKEAGTLLAPFRYKINGSGFIEKLPDEGMESLVAEIPKTDNPKQFDDFIRHAHELFHKRSATIDDKISALDNLFKAAELVRSKAKGLETEMAFGGFFDKVSAILNDQVRHNKSYKKDAFLKDNPVMIDWLYYSARNNLNTWAKLQKQLKQHGGANS